MAGVVSTVRLLQLIHARPTSSLLAVDELQCWLQVRNLQLVCRYTADVALAHGLPRIAEARRAVQGGCFHGYAGHSDGGDRQLHARVPPEVGGTHLVTGLLRLADVPTMYMAPCT